MPSFTHTLVVINDFDSHKAGDTIIGHDAIMAVMGGKNADKVQMRRDLHDPTTGQPSGRFMPQVGTGRPVDAVDQLAELQALPAKEPK